jgi:UDP-N-acetylglucosamine pyrophosphorylase
MLKNYVFPPNVGNADEVKKYIDIGKKALSYKEVAVVTAAGGLSSRCGLKFPKGFLTIEENKSLFEIYANQIRGFDWYIMTSDFTHAPTVNFFRERNFFDCRTRFFCQDNSQVIHKDGTESQIPSGHGALFKALLDDGVLNVMVDRHINYVIYIQIDNPLIKVIDPLFLGLHITHAADISTKLVKKSNAYEKCGTFINGEVIDYSEVTPTVSRDNIFGYTGVHIFSLSFLINTACKVTLPWHRTKGIQGLKQEKFIFDILKHTDKKVFLEVLREDEFSPIKNAQGIYSIDSARIDYKNKKDRKV